MSEEIDYAERVQRGIALLDVKWPDWATEIDLEKLDIEWGDRCVTAQYAQLHGSALDRDVDSWQDGRSMLDLGNREYELHGFNADGQSTGEAYAPDPGGYATLNGLWRSEIERRRAQGQDAPAEPEASA
jgi:hypothetical protein